MSNYRRLNFFAIIAIILLRVGIGWHFYKEGVAKVQDGKFSSAGMLGSAKGPLADRFHSLLPDHDGKIRLDAKRMNQAIEDYSQKVGEHYALSSEQLEKLNRETKRFTEGLAEIYERWSKEIKDYQQGLGRNIALDRDPKYDEVGSLRSQRDEIETKWKALPKPAFSAIDSLMAEMEESMQAVASAEQQADKKPLSFVLPGEAVFSTRLVDKIIPIFDMVIGILLILGLLTPLAALAAAGFLISVVLSQFPGYPGAQPTYFQAVEALACLVLAGTDAGRYGGLDYLSWSWWQVRNAGGFEYD